MPGFLAMADYGVKAPQMSRIIDAFIEKAQQEQDLRFGEREVLGRTVYTFDLSEMELDMGDVGFDEDDFDPMMGGFGVPDPDAMLDQLSELHYVRGGEPPTDEELRKRLLVD